MKEFISGVAMLIVLLIFPLQSTADTIHTFRINQMNEVIFNACEQARFDGYFTSDNITTIKNKLSNVFDVTTSEIVVNATSSIKYRTNAYDEKEKIEYEIIVPFNNIIASANFLGISEEDNSSSIVKKGHVFSEVLKP